MPRRGYRRLGYRGVYVYLARDIHTALVLKALNEGRTISDIINEALEEYLERHGGIQTTSNPNS